MLVLKVVSMAEAAARSLRLKSLKNAKNRYNLWRHPLPFPSLLRIPSSRYLTIPSVDRLDNKCHFLHALAVLPWDSTRNQSVDSILATVSDTERNRSQPAEQEHPDLVWHAGRHLSRSGQADSISTERKQRSQRNSLHGTRASKGPTKRVQSHSGLLYLWPRWIPSICQIFLGQLEWLLHCEEQSVPESLGVCRVWIGLHSIQVSIIYSKWTLCRKFNEAGRLLDEQLSSLGGKRLLERGMVDMTQPGKYNEELESWFPSYMKSIHKEVALFKEVDPLYSIAEGFQDKYLRLQPPSSFTYVYLIKRRMDV